MPKTKKKTTTTKKDPMECDHSDLTELSPWQPINNETADPDDHSATTEYRMVHCEDCDIDIQQGRVIEESEDGEE